MQTVHEFLSSSSFCVSNKQDSYLGVSDYQQKTTNSVVGKGEGKVTFVGLEEPREGIENDVSIGDGDFVERNDLDRLEEGPHWDEERRREEEARRERGRHEQSEREYPMTNYFGSATPGE